VTYPWTFLAVAVVLVLTPGADFAVIVRNTVSGGRPTGIATTIGVSAAAALQGLLVSFGLASLALSRGYLTGCFKVGERCPYLG